MSFIDCYYSEASFAAALGNDTLMMMMMMMWPLSEGTSAALAVGEDR